MADWIRQCGEWAQSRDAGTAQRPWDALDAPPRQSHAGLTHSGVQRALGGSLGTRRSLASGPAALAQAAAGNAATTASMLAGAGLAQALRSVVSSTWAEAVGAERTQEGGWRSADSSAPSSHPSLASSTALSSLPCCKTMTHTLLPHKKAGHHRIQRPMMARLWYCA